MTKEQGMFEAEMNRGFLQILVMAVLEREMYGYMMLKHFIDIGYEVEENTLYPLLRRLEKNGYIQSEWVVTQDRPRKFYTVTKNGRMVRDVLMKKWKHQNVVLEKILEGEKYV